MRQDYTCPPMGRLPLYSPTYQEDPCVWEPPDVEPRFCCSTGWVNNPDDGFPEELIGVWPCDNYFGARPEFGL
eukprot:12921857-Prorocentrum_lima.AAC.1